MIHNLDFGLTSMSEYDVVLDLSGKLSTHHIINGEYINTLYSMVYTCMNKDTSLACNLLG